MPKIKLLISFIVMMYALLLMTGCGKDENSMSSSTANEVFKNYYAALTGTMSASAHHNQYQWKTGSEPFPYMEEAKWTDFSNNLRGCNNEDIARLNGVYDTYSLNIGYQDSQEAIDRVAEYWKSKGWEVKDISSANDPDMKQITTTTDTDINMKYTASSRGEDIEVISKCIPEFYDEENPTETPQVFKAEQP